MTSENIALIVFQNSDSSSKPTDRMAASTRQLASASSHSAIATASTTTGEGEQLTLGKYCKELGITHEINSTVCSNKLNINLLTNGAVIEILNFLRAQKLSTKVMRQYDKQRGLKSTERESFNCQTFKLPSPTNQFSPRKGPRQ